VKRSDGPLAGSLLGRCSPHLCWPTGHVHSAALLAVHSHSLTQHSLTQHLALEPWSEHCGGCGRLEGGETP
jgi:hypothetical protein